MNDILKNGIIGDILNKEARKGFLKIFILKIIDEKPSHGYNIIQEIARKSNGHWTPSPGSIYPTLEYLESKGYIISQEVNRKKIYSITPKGENAIRQLKEKSKQLMQELIMFFGDILE